MGVGGELGAVGGASVGGVVNRHRGGGRVSEMMCAPGWADKIANKAFRKAGGALFNGEVQPLLLAEHRRAVRVVKQEIEAVKNDQRTYRSEERCLILGSLETVLKALQRGRE